MDDNPLVDRIVENMIDLGETGLGRIIRTYPSTTPNTYQTLNLGGDIRGRVYDLWLLRAISTG